MLFNSTIYIFCFLPIVVVVYFFLNRLKMVVAGKSWLVAASLFFYSYWNPKYLTLIIFSILVNYGIGSGFNGWRNDLQLLPEKSRKRKAILLFGIIFNLCLLSYFKYSDFFIANFNAMSGFSLPLPHLVLPLAISFFTFQQIGYLLDSYRGGTREYDFLHYCLFVTFFPQLIAGPIVRHQEMMPQFQKLRNVVINWDNIARGIFIFVIGLFKKVCVADTFSLWASRGYDSNAILSCMDAWITSLSYTLQIYFDFSGYSDMAIGAALLINIRLPVNFNSPYKSTSIQNFWRTWHMTLSSWLRDYLYIPLGGNKTVLIACRNVLVTFFLGGLWHGAGWTFVIWGLLHGLMMVVNRLWQLMGVTIPRFLACLITFICLNTTFVVFRSESIPRAVSILKSLAGAGDAHIWSNFREMISSGSAIFQWHQMPGSILPGGAPLFLFIFALIVFFLPNSMEISGYLGNKMWTFRRNIFYGMATGAIAGAALTLLLLSKGSEFLYFNF